MYLSKLWDFVTSPGANILNIPTSIPKGCQEEKEEQGPHPSSLPVVLTKCSKLPPILEEYVQERNQKKGSLRRTGSLCLPVTYRVALLCSGKRGPSCFLGFIQTQRCFWVNKVVLGYEWMNTPIRAAARGKRDIYWLRWKQLILHYFQFYFIPLIRHNWSSKMRASPEGWSNLSNVKKKLIIHPWQLFLMQWFIR